MKDIYSDDVIIHSMKNIEKLIESLNLIYYEYEKSSNSFILDRNYSNEHIFEELIKITYLLSKHNINFFVDEKKSLVLNAEDSFFSKIKKAMGFAAHGLLVSSMILWFYECPKNDGRRRLCERQRRASPKRRDRIIIKPMIALSADAVI